jgi:hypothetical protein
MRDPGNGIRLPRTEIPSYHGYMPCGNKLKTLAMPVAATATTHE